MWFPYTANQAWLPHGNSLLNLRPEIPNQLLATSNLMRDGCCLLQLDWRLPFNFFGPMPCFLQASH
jgi:hypothetical protein